MEESAEDRAAREYRERERAKADPKLLAEQARLRAAEARAAAAAAELERRRAAAERAAANAAERERAMAEAAAAAAERRRAAEAAAAERAAAAAAERERREAEAAAAAAERKRVADERAAATAAERERREAEAAAAAAERKRIAEERAAAATAEAARQRDETARRRAEAERAAEEARAKAAADKAAAAAAVERAAAERAAADVKAQQAAVDADVDAARKANSSGAWAGLLAKRAGLAVAGVAEAELQRAVVREADTWLTASAPAPTPALADLPLARAPPSLRDDLAALRAKSWRALAPRAVDVSWTLRNPTGRPMLVHLDFAGQRRHVLVPATAPLAGRSSFACALAGEPSKGVRDGVLEYRYGCATTAKLQIRGAHPVEAELAVDRKAADAGLALEAAAALLQALPASWLAEVWADRVDEAMAAFATGTDAVQASAKVGRPAAGAGTPVEVAFRNGSRFDATVFYTVGTGRIERLLVERGKGNAIKLVTTPGLSPRLEVLRLMPRLRSREWLHGAWRTLRATLAITPARGGGLQALLLGRDAAGLPRTVAAPLTIEGDRFRFAAAVGPEFAARLLGDTDSLPLQCDAACEVRVSGSLTRQEQFEDDGRRALLVDVEVGNRQKSLLLHAQH